MRFALLWISVIACTSSGGQSASDVLCDPSGVWTRLFIAQEACSVRTLGGPEFGAAYQERNCRAIVDPLLAAGTAKLADASVIDACRQALDTHTCQRALFKDYAAAIKICDDVLVGAQQTGEACSVDEECAGTSFCSRPGTCGVCTAVLAIGTPCESGGQCSSGVCASGACAAANQTAGFACTTDAQCANGLACEGGSCAVPLAVGQTCTSGIGCDISKGSCVTPMVNGTFDEHGKCTALGKAGATCSPFGTGQTDKVNCDWLGELGCIAGRCAILPEVAIGAACGFDTARCAGSATCANGTCQKIAAEGEFCDDTISCGPYALCVEHACQFIDFNDACYPDATPPPSGPGT